MRHGTGRDRCGLPGGETETSETRGEMGMRGRLEYGRYMGYGRCLRKVTNWLTRSMVV